MEQLNWGAQGGAGGDTAQATRAGGSFRGTPTCRDSDVGNEGATPGAERTVWSGCREPAENSGLSKARGQRGDTAQEASGILTTQASGKRSQLWKPHGRKMDKDLVRR